jgi:hypothetical protein
VNRLELTCNGLMPDFVLVCVGGVQVEAAMDDWSQRCSELQSHLDAAAHLTTRLNSRVSKAI